MVFNLVATVQGDGELVARKYKSDLSGLTAVIAHVEGPLVNGYLTFATEAHDDDGIPHTLEHLCFMGSEKYPYKGVLDLLANRCLASGTNAWTDTDHTCYTMTTAGSDGFLNLLPVYLDHVLYPTLTDGAFVTEVHHINEDGEDAGVVYCEMQGRENSGESRCHLEMVRAMYPGRCGYKSETGGLMKNLRESTTNEKIRKYHAEVYRPENLCVIITGNVEDEDVIKTLASFEEKIVEKRKVSDGGDWVRPWQDPVPPLPETVEKIVEYPCDDDNNGLVYIAWRGPTATQDFETSIAINLLVEYLNDTAVAPLQQAFIETDDPFCSYISTGFIENSESCIYLSFESVPKEKLELVKDQLFSVLNDIVNGTQPFDITRMKNIVHRNIQQLLSKIEKNAHIHAASSIIGDFLYGNTERDLAVRFRQIPIIEKWGTEGPNFWLDLTTKYFIQNKYVLIVGKPSPALLESSTLEEKQRVEKQREQLGLSGLKEKAQVLDEAKKSNEEAPPVEMITKVPIPKIESIHFHSVTRVTNGADSTGEVVQGFSEIQRVPFRLQIDDLKTNFISIRALLNTSTKVPPELRLYLPLWCELLTESSVLRDGVLISYEDIVTQLSTDTISSETDIGVGDQFEQVVTVFLKTEEGKYEKGINWLRELLYNTQFNGERVKTVTKRIVNNLALLKRKGMTVASDLLRSTNYGETSNYWAKGTFRQLSFLNALLAKLESNPQSVVDDLNKLRDVITSLENITVHVSLNAKHLTDMFGQDLTTPWIKSFLPAHLQGQQNLITSKVVPSHELVIAKTDLTGTIAGVGSVESNYMAQTVSSIKSFSDPDVAPLLVVMQYLTQLEGPMWRQIRGMGLSYHYNISLQITEGLLYFVLFKSTHIVNAYAEAVKIVERYVSGEEPWDDALLDSSRSSLAYELVAREKSVSGVSLQSVLCYLRGVDASYTKDLVAKVSRVTLDDVKRVAPIYLTPLFDSSKSRCALCCHPSKVPEVVEGFKGFKRDLAVVNLDESSSFVSKI